MFKFLSLLFIFCFILQYRSISQVKFERLYSSLGMYYIESVCNTSDAGYALAGYKAINNNGWYRALYLKIDSLGNLTCAKTSSSPFMEQIIKIRPTTDGGTISIGVANGNNGFMSGIIVKLSSAFTFQWQTVLENQLYTTEFRDIWQTQDGGFIVTGDYLNTISILYIARLKVNGQVAWFKEYRKTGNQLSGVNSIRQIPGGYLVSGLYKKSTVYSGFLARLDTNGNMVWAKSIGDSIAPGNGMFLDITKDGNCILTTTVMDNSGNYSLIDIKSDFNGNILWAESIRIPGTKISLGQTNIKSDGSCIHLARNMNGSTVYLINTNVMGNVIWSRKIWFLAVSCDWDVIQSADRGYIHIGNSNNIDTNGFYSSYVFKTDTNGKSSIYGCHDTAVSFTVQPKNITSSNFTLTSMNRNTYSTATMTLTDVPFYTSLLCTNPIGKFSSDRQRICSGDSINFFDSSLVNPIGYEWIFPGGNPATSNLKNPVNIKYKNPGKYPVTLKVYNSASSDTLTKTDYIEVLPLPVPDFTINDTTQCLRNNSFHFNNLTAISSGTFTNIWKFGNGDTSFQKDPVYSYKNKGKYSVDLIAISDFGCVDSLAKNIYIFPNVKSNYMIDDSSKCIDSNKFIFTNTSINPAGTFSSLWIFSDGRKDTSINIVHSFPKEGVYNVELIVTSNFNCKDSIIKKVYVCPLPEFELGKSNYICPGDEIKIDPGSYMSYLWQDSSTNRIYPVKSAGKYWVIVTNANGCIYSDTTVVFEQCQPVLYIPNAFTPNGDLHNDLFDVKGENISQYSIEIYNRWGVQIFSNQDINNPWDGKYKGVDCPADVYYWMIVYSGIYKGIKSGKTLCGSVTLMK